MPQDDRHRLPSPFWALIAFAIWSPVSIAGANIAWGTALVLWGARALLDRKRGGPPPLHRTALDPALALFFFASLLSVCVSLDPAASVVEFRSLGLMAVYFLFAWNVSCRRQARILLVCWFALSAAAAAYAALEYFTGWDFLGHYDPRTNKIGGFFSMHLTFSEYIALALCLCAGVLLWDAPAGKARRAALRAAFAVMLFGFLLARAKGAWLGLLAGMSLVCGLRGRRALAAMWGLVLLTLLLVAAWNAQALRSEFLTFSIDADRAAGYVHSNTQRLFMWWSGLRISVGHFLNGVGLHAVGAVYPDFRHALAQDPNQWHLHSNLIQLGVTRGLFGLAGFLYLFLLAGRNGIARFRTSPDPWERGLCAGALGACVAFLASGLPEYSRGDSEVLMALYMVLGLALSAPAGTAGAEAPVPGEGGGSAARKAGFCLFAGTVCAASIALPADRVGAGARVLEGALGLLLFAPVLLRRPSGGAAAGAEIAFNLPWPGPGAVPWRMTIPTAVVARAVACSVTFAGYGFTRPLWVAAEGQAHDPGLLVAAGAVLLSGGAMVLSRPGRGRAAGGCGWGLFDTSVVGAAALWTALALGTGGLLGLASGGHETLAPPVPAVVLLCAFVVLLYGLTRILYRRGRAQDTLLAVLGACMLAHAFRGG